MFTELLPKLATDTHPSASIILSALQAPVAPPSGTMKAWLQARHGKLMHTVQQNKKDSSYWIPLNREVDSQTKATGVFFNDSLRDYRGMRVVSSADNMLIVEDDFNLIAYIESEDN